jgi:hypothetical protein
MTTFVSRLGDESMSRRTARRTLASAGALIALALAFSVSAQGSASAQVYRCKQSNGAIVYQDYPCKGGVTVDIKPDAADPTAIERLRRAEAEFDRSYAQRRAAEAAQQRVQRPSEPLPPEVDNGFEPEAPAYLFYGPVARSNFDHRDRRVMHRIIVPKRHNPAVTHRPHRLEIS